jgi:hypothetical protein
VFAALFVLAAVYIIPNEGADNWQAMWTGAIYFVLAGTLWQARAAVAEVATTVTTVVLREAGPESQVLGNAGEEARLTPPARSHVPG